MLRVGLIGETGGGEYGHGLEKLFVGRSDGVVVAIADSGAAKRAEVAAQIGDPRQYDDWRVKSCRGGDGHSVASGGAGRGRAEGGKR